MRLKQELSLMNVVPSYASKKQVLSTMEDIHQQLKHYRKKVFEGIYDDEEMLYDLAHQQIALQKEWFNNPNSTIRWYVSFAKECLRIKIEL